MPPAKARVKNRKLPSPELTPPLADISSVRAMMSPIITKIAVIGFDRKLTLANGVAMPSTTLIMM